MGGTPYQAVYRLYAIASERWAEIDAAYASIDLIRQPVHRFVNLTYAWCLTRIEPEKLEEWMFMLNSPFPGEKVVSDQMLEDEGAAFLALMGQVNG